MLKKTFLLPAFLLAFGLLAMPAWAAEFKSGQDVNLNAGEAISGDFYAASSNLEVDADMPGDAFLAGSIVRVAGNTAQSLFVAGSMVNVTGNVGHALRVAGSQVTIGGTVEGDVIAAGGMVYILPTADIKGDLYVGAGTAVIEGKVEGGVKVGGGDVTLRGTVGKDVEGQVDKLVLAPPANIGGDLNYRSPKEADWRSGATVVGQTHYQKVEQNERQSSKAAGRGAEWGLGVLFFVFFWIVYVVVALLGNYFFRQRVADITTRVLSNFAKQTGWGFIWFVIIPVACILILFTLIGIPVSFFGFIFYCLLMGLAKILAAIILGAWLLKLMVKQRGIKVDWKAILLGVTVFLLIACIPFLGWLCALVLTLSALGGLMEALKPIAK